MSTLLCILFWVWFTGYWAGVGLYLFKYMDYGLHKDYYMSDETLKDYYTHDHTIQMRVRNFLFYCCLSWYGVYRFIKG